jgi:anti-sigma factor RsiW
MDCTKIQEQMLDQMSASSANANISAHTATCADCAKLWHAMQASSAALDEWTAPEPSPYFNTRFQARLAEVKREEAAKPAGVFAGLRSLFRQPVSVFHSGARMAALAAAVAVAVAVGIYERPSSRGQNDVNQALVSPAVNDLQKLDKDEDLYADFEMLDDLQTDNSQPANGNTSSGAKSEL